MAKIAFLGLGAMGTRMVESLLAENISVTVWNRSLAKAERLCAAGAKLAKSPREAAVNADVVFAMVRDDAASRYVWLDSEGGALMSMSPTALAVECSTLSVNFVRELHKEFEGRSKRFIEAPLAGSRPQAEAKKLIFFTSGKLEDVNEVNGLLLKMGSVNHYCGGAGSGVAVKLMVNALFGAQVALMAELITFVKNLNLDIKRVVEIISSTPVCSPAAAMSANMMLEENFKPLFPVDLVAKDFSLLALSAALANTELPISSAVGKVFDLGKEKGLAQSNITGIIQLYKSA